LCNYTEPLAVLLLLHFFCSMSLTKPSPTFRNTHREQVCSLAKAWEFYGTKSGNPVKTHVRRWMQFLFFNTSSGWCTDFTRTWIQTETIWFSIKLAHYSQNNLTKIMNKSYLSSRQVKIKLISVNLIIIIIIISSSTVFYGNPLQWPNYSNKNMAVFILF